MLLIRGGRLHTMEDDRPFVGDILIREGKIVRIGPRLRPGGDAAVLDAAGLEVFPGFIDAHSHIGLAQEKSTPQADPSNEATGPVMPHIRAIDGVNPMDSAFHNALAAGITGVMVGPGSANPIGGQFAFLKTTGRRVEDMVVLAPAAMKIAFGENPIASYGAGGSTPATRMGVAALIREELFRARAYLESAPSRKDFRLECYRPLFQGQIPLKAHVHRADDIFTAMRIAGEFGLGLTLDHCTEGHLIADAIAASGYPAIVGPSLAARTKDEVGQSDFKIPGLLHKAGVLLALTTDHPVSRIQYLPLCAGLAAREGLGEEAALRAITIDAARICRVDSRVGSLKPGKDADVVLFRGNPLDSGSALRAVVLEGRMVWPPEEPSPPG